MTTGYAEKLKTMSLEVFHPCAQMQLLPKTGARLSCVEVDHHAERLSKAVSSCLFDRGSHVERNRTLRQASVGSTQLNHWSVDRLCQQSLARMDLDREVLAPRPQNRVCHRCQRRKMSVDGYTELVAPHQAHEDVHPTRVCACDCLTGLWQSNLRSSCHCCSRQTCDDHLAPRYPFLRTLCPDRLDLLCGRRTR